MKYRFEIFVQQSPMVFTTSSFSTSRIILSNSHAIRFPSDIFRPDKTAPRPGNGPLISKALKAQHQSILIDVHNFYSAIELQTSLISRKISNDSIAESFAIHSEPKENSSKVGANAM